MSESEIARLRSALSEAEGRVKAMERLWHDIRQWQAPPDWAGHWGRVCSLMDLALGLGDGNSLPDPELEAIEAELRRSSRGADEMGKWNVRATPEASLLARTARAAESRASVLEKALRNFVNLSNSGESWEGARMVWSLAIAQAALAPQAPEGKGEER